MVSSGKSPQIQLFFALNAFRCWPKQRLGRGYGMIFNAALLVVLMTVRLHQIEGLQRKN